MRGSFRSHLILLLAMAFAGPTLGDTDPSLSQVYEALQTGHVEQAQKMMKEVLHDHPKSAKAHYVAAEVNAASGNFVQGRQELSLAQELAPGLPFAAPGSVRELQDKLSRTPSVRMPLAREDGGARETGGASTWSVPVVVVIGMGVVLAFVFIRRRAPTDSYGQSREVEPPPAAGSPATVAAAGFPPGAGTGVGPSIAGDLAGGLAAGAGIVAGEEIARHLLNSGEHEVNSPPASEIAQERQESEHLGGLNFGVSGTRSWDDDDQPSGGDDWT
jgi:uncharacterized protein